MPKIRRIFLSLLIKPVSASTIPSASPISFVAFDTEKYIAWESELPVWKLEKNQVTVEQTGRMPYPFSEIAEVPRYWSAKAAFQVKRNNPVEILRNSQRYRGKTEETTESDNKENTSGAVQ